MPTFGGDNGSSANSTLPTSFSYGPASPQGFPLRTSSRRSTRSWTTRASATFDRNAISSAAPERNSLKLRGLKLIGLSVDGCSPTVLRYSLHYSIPPRKTTPGGTLATLAAIGCDRRFHCSHCCFLAAPG